MFTAEFRQLEVLRQAAQDRGSELIPVTKEEIEAVTQEEMDGFSYHAHPDNIALALKVCADLGVDRQTAISGMWKARPDAGAMTEHRIEFFGKKIYFVNGFAANDPESTEQIWRMTLDKHSTVKKTVALFNCRADRPDRSMQLGRAYVQWPQADHVVLMGGGTYIFARAAVAAGLEESKLIFLEGNKVDEIFESLVGLIRSTGLIMGMANIGGQGLDLVSYFRNREAPMEAL